MTQAGTAAEEAAPTSPTPRPPRPGFRRPLAALLALLVGVPLVLLAIAATIVIVMALLGLSIDASRWRDAVAQQASAALGRPVVVAGALELAPTLGREVAVRIGSVRIPNAPGFAGQDLLAVEELHVRLDLVAALRGGLRSSSIEAGRIALHLERGADGKGNWTVSAARDAGTQPPVIDLARIALHRLELDYHDVRSAMRRSVQLEDVVGSIGHDRPLRLAARGRLQPGHDFTFAIDGGPLRRLLEDAEDWPFSVYVDAPGMRLQANAVLDARHGTARAQVEARADDLAAVGRAVGSPMPDVGKSSLSSMVTVAAGLAHISEMLVRLGESELAGQLSLAFGGARPRVSGTLRAPVLDLGPILAASTPSENPQTGSAARAEQALPLRSLSAIDAEVDLTIERLLGLGVDVRDTRLGWRADERGVRMPISAMIAGTALTGDLDLDTSAPTPSLALRLGADNTALGDLMPGLGGDSFNGTVGRVRLRADARGESVAALASDLEISLAVAGARLRLARAGGTSPLDVAIDSLELAARRGERLQGQARGALQGERAQLRIRSGKLPDMLRERMVPLELDLALAPARLRVDGTLASAATKRVSTVRFDFQARRAGDLARWIGVSPQADLPVAARGTVRLSESSPALAATLKVGRSQAAIDARTLSVNGRPRIVASLRSELIDASELSQLAAGRGANGGDRPRSTARPAPASKDLTDADIDIRVQRLLLRRAEVRDLAFVARTRDGRVLPSSVDGRIGGAPFTADFDADLRGAIPAANLRLATGQIDLGALLRGLGIAEDLDGNVQTLRLDLQGRGSSVAELARQSSFDLRVTGGSLAVRGAAGSTIADIIVDEARIRAPAGEPVRARLDGRIDQTPVTIDVASGTLADFARNAGHLPFALDARAAESRLALDGEVSLPLGSGGKLNLQMRGERLELLSTLARVELPGWGPWSFSSPIRMTTTGYELPSLHAKVGSSELRGAAKLDLSGPRPDLRLKVTAPTIQLDDFPLPQRLTDSPAAAAEDGGLRRTASRLAGRTDRLLSVTFLRRFDATLDVKAKEVLSGADRLLDGSLRLKLAAGNLSLDPAVINLPAGTIRLSISYALKEPDVELAVAARVERFDYGVFARRIDRAQNLRGLISLDLDLVGSAPSLETIMHNANGKVDFAIWPDELSGGVFNFWSVNLLLKVVPLIDTDTRPKVNCIIGRFDLEDGILNDEKILIDTSAVRIRGAGRANLATEKLEFVFRPRAKGLALFRLQNPLHVTGSLGEPRFGFQRRDTLEAVFRQVASPILLPIERLVLGPLPRDGADVCADPLRAFAATRRSAAE